MVLPIEQRDVVIDLNKPVPRLHDQFAELDARNSSDPVFVHKPILFFRPKGHSSVRRSQRLRSGPSTVRPASVSLGFAWNGARKPSTQVGANGVPDGHPWRTREEGWLERLGRGIRREVVTGRRPMHRGASDPIFELMHRQLSSLWATLGERSRLRAIDLGDASA